MVQGEKRHLVSELLHFGVVIFRKNDGDLGIGSLVGRDRKNPGFGRVVLKRLSHGQYLRREGVKKLLKPGVLLVGQHVVFAALEAKVQVLDELGLFVTAGIGLIHDEGAAPAVIETGDAAEGAGAAGEDGIETEVSDYLLGTAFTLAGIGQKPEVAQRLDLGVEPGEKDVIDAELQVQLR